MTQLIVLFVGVVIFAAIVVGVDGVFSGWSALGARYATSSRPEEPLRFRSAELIGTTRMRYRGTIEIGTSENGFYLAHIPRLWPGHPPVFIPWEAITGRWPEHWSMGHSSGDWDCFEVPTASRVVTILLPADVVPPTPPEKKQARFLSNPAPGDVTAQTARLRGKKAGLRARSRPR
jgi:hypothetical protein